MLPRTPLANLTFAYTLKPVVNSLKQKRQGSAVLRFVFWSISSLLIANTVCQAQNIQHTENKPDLALRSDVRVDPSTLGMSFSIPLASYPGRAGHGLPVAITYSSKSLRLEFTGVDYTPITGAKTWTTLKFAEHSTAGWTSTLSPPRIEFTGMGQFFDGQGHPACADVCFPGQNIVGDHYIKRIHVHMPDGSSHELRLDDDAHFFPLEPFTGTFQAVDGSRMRFESNAGAPSVLYLPDGSRYLFGPYNSGTELTATNFIDRNGNTLTYNATSRQWTDTLNRTITNPLPASPIANTETYFQAKLVGGTDATYTFRWKYLADVLTPDPATGQPPPLRYPGDNKCAHNSYPSVFPYLFNSNTDTKVCVEQDESGNPVLFNPVVLSEIVLPTGKFYRFTYTVYGEIDKILLTTGATDRFVYNQVATLSFSAVPYSQINRGVTQRRLSATGSSTDESVWTYSVMSTNPYTVRATAPDLSYSERLLHQSRYTISGFASFEFDDARMGMAYEERSYNSSGVMLRRQLSKWVEGGTPGGAARDPKVNKQVSIILDDAGSNALTATTVNRYEQASQPLNLTSTTEYGFDNSMSKTTAQTAGVDSFNPADSLAIRTTETAYLDNTDYSARNLVSLPVSVQIKTGMPVTGQVIARSEMVYDELALLLCSATVGRSDPGVAARGNVTKVKKWLNTLGAVTNPSAFLSAQTQYDQCGNVRKIWDARDTTLSNPTQIEYSHQSSYPTLNTSADPDGSGPLSALTTSTEYDVDTGLVTATVDANGQRTTFSYNDPLNRLKQVVRAATDATAKNQSTYSYNDDARTITATSDLNTYSDNLLKTVTKYDGLGRMTETQIFEDATNYITTQQQYDTSGRVFRISNPFRNETPAWTTTTYDSLSRVLTVTTPDNAVVTTSYSGNTVTVTDQAGKLRRSVTDALGRLTRVDEPDSNNSLGTVSNPNQPTSYNYDTLDNLVKVTQGTQQRFFMYDSIKRLVRSRNPEQATLASLSLSDPISGNSSWSIGYQYDSNGNLTQKTDARGVVSTYDYDALNRNTNIDYSDTASITPDVTRFYDGASNGKGRLWKSYAGGSEATGANVERSVIDSYDALGRPFVLNQSFKLNNQWKDPYTTRRVYNLAGAVTSQIYPSGHVVNYNYDLAGRLADKDANNLAFNGNLGDGNPLTYSRGITYAPAGQMKQEQFGTDTAVYNKLFYNSRQQLAEILISTSGGDNSWNRGKILNDYSLQCSGAGCNATDNNGNLRKQTVFIPANEQNSSNTSWYQQYDYDELNRLKRVHEYTGNTSLDWQQEFLYDQWGNRRIDTNATKTFGIGINNRDFLTEDATNRLYAPGDLALQDDQRRIRYDAMGNQTKDIYTGYGTASFDAENHITAIQDNTGGTSTYTYNADGQRTRRKTGTQETWQIYGMDGELLAEYPQAGATYAPQKEYGYRNGQLLITAEPGNASAAPVFSDDFDDNSLNANSWSVYYPGLAPTVSEQSQQLQITLSPNSAAYNGVYSNSLYDLTNRMVQVESVQSVSQAGWCENFLEVELNANNYFMIQVGAGNMLFRSRVNGVNDQTSIPFDGMANRFWRIRHDQSLNQIYFETSANGAVWLTRKTVTAGFALTSLRFHLLAGAYGTGNSNPGAAKYDNFKLLASLAPTSLTVPNSGFETPLLGNGNFQYSPSGGSWSFANGAGISSMNSPFTGVPSAAPDGVQVAFIQGGGTVSQLVSGFQANASYVITFSAIQRTNCCNTTGQDIAVYIDSTQVGTFHPSNTAYVEYSTAPFSTTTGAHTIKFAGSNVNGDQTAFMDKVRITGNPKPGFGVQWLVTDQLGTPRLILDQTGSLANIKRHDYLPFGEELFAGTGARTTSIGYTGSDGVRQQFTQKERDAETGLDYFNARYYSNIQGRFTDSDPGAFTPADPQNFNRYSYVQNSPLKFIDPTGRDLTFIGADADYIVSELARFTGLKLNRDPKTGKVTIDKSVKRNMKGTSTWFANKIIQIVGDSTAEVKINTGRSQPGVFFDAYQTSQLDVDDYDAFKKADDKFAAESLAHVIEEYYYEQRIPLTDIPIMGVWVPAGPGRGPLSRDGRFPESHFSASGFESQVLSDFTGWWEKPYEDKKPVKTSAGEVIKFEFSTVIYDVTKKNSNVVSITKYELQKPRKN